MTRSPSSLLVLLNLPLGVSCGDTNDTSTEGDHTAPLCTSGEVTDHRGIAMAYICPGTFLMGSPPEEVGRRENEAVHRVTLTEGFYVGVYEVTQEQFQDLMGYQPSHLDGCRECPVENLNWNEAAAFTNAVSAEEGLPPCYSCTGTEAEMVCELSSAFPTPYDCDGYRLLTEAEWEYAARAGTTSAFANGGNLLAGDEQNCDGRLELDNGTYLSDMALYCMHNNGTKPVGTKQANRWGLFDMHGNVGEWCHDYVDGEDYHGDAIDPWGDQSGTLRAARGGTWAYVPSGVRSAARTSPEPSLDDAGAYIGFRVAKSK